VNSNCVPSISVITESKKKLHSTKETENYTVIYSGVNRYTRSQLGVMICVHKSFRYKIAYYKLLNNRNYCNKTKTHRGHLKILGVYVPIEGKKQNREEFYETLQNILDKVNKNDYIMLIGNLNDRE
jgi:CRISPR/Cas system CSM-associated protein Csm2 small subunit